ncbi:MAG: hypothetical protein HZC40_25100 [Chloroflexi bacterium]|nr:hypothetical protein [Chloroflexota bacterium]
MTNLVSPQPQIGLMEFARLVIDTLEQAEIDYMVAGALAVAAWAEARSTQDVDVVINLPIEQMRRLSIELEKRKMLVPADVMLDLYLDAQADLPINAIHLSTGYKAELFFVRPADAYRVLAFSRRLRVDLGAPLGEVYVHAPEDLILNKLRYFQISEQPKHVRDIASILVALRDQLDHAYIAEWAERFGVTALWNEAQRRAALL